MDNLSHDCNADKASAVRMWPPVHYDNCSSCRGWGLPKCPTTRWCPRLVNLDLSLLYMDQGPDKHFTCLEGVSELCAAFALLQHPIDHSPFSSSTI